MSQSILPRVVAAIRAASKGNVPGDILPEHSFVLDLGFDSMRMVILGLALEDQFARPILLDMWLGSHSDPADLTVTSLCSFLEEAMAA